MTFAKTMLLAVGVLICSAALSAEERVVNLFTCELNDGKTMDDVQTANGLWVRHMNENVPGGDIRSYPAAPIVGETSKFLYMDSFPSLTSWAQMTDITNSGSEEVHEIMNGLDEVASCSRNSLYRAVESE